MKKVYHKNIYTTIKKKPLTIYRGIDKIQVQHTNIRFQKGAQQYEEEF